jgi:hypothetical protein
LVVFYHTVHLADSAGRTGIGIVAADCRNTRQNSHFTARIFYKEPIPADDSAW